MKNTIAIVSESNPVNPVSARVAAVAKVVDLGDDSVNVYTRKVYEREDDEGTQPVSYDKIKHAVYFNHPAVYETDQRRCLPVQLWRL